jgi:hypothetical protein
MQLDIILQTCTNKTNQEGERYCKAAKSEVSRRCAISLVKSINACDIPDFKINLTVLDDHSDLADLEVLDNIFKTVSNYKLINLETTGVMESISACYKYGLENTSELVYFAQDDYLFELNAIKEMIEAYYYFKYMLRGQDVGIYPFNDPYRYYIPANIEITRVVHGPNRHWRLNYFTASCFMVHHETIEKHWDLFEAMGNSDCHDTTMEDRTINQLWQKQNVALFTPIPSLALHMQFDSEKDPYIDWEKLWNESTII